MEDFLKAAKWIAIVVILFYAATGIRIVHFMPEFPASFHYVWYHSFVREAFMNEMKKGAESTQIGSQAPNFTLQNLDGENVSLNDFRGKPVLLVFWRTTCPPCIAEIPMLSKLHEEFKEKGFAILGVAQEDGPTVEEYIKKKQHIPYTVILDKDIAVAKLYGVGGIPQVVFVDKKGIIKYRAMGYDLSKKAETLEKYRALIKEMLAE